MFDLKWKESSKYDILDQMRYDRSKVNDEYVRFLGVFAKNKLLTHVFVHIFWTVENMEKLRQYATFRIW